jgi:integrase
MSVTVRPYRRGGWEADIRVVLPDHTEHRQRRKAPVSSKSAAQRWGEAREREWYSQLANPQPVNESVKEVVPTLTEFAPRFLEGHARANRHKPSGIAAHDSIVRVHLIPLLGASKLDRITSEEVQLVKRALHDRAPKTVNNVLTVLSVLFKKAVEWQVIDRMPCTIRLLPTSTPSAHFHDFEAYERVVDAGQRLDARAYLVVLLGGDAGLRCGEIAALEWGDVDLEKRLLCIQRSLWKGHVTTPKSGRLRYVPMTVRLAAALREHRHLRGRRVLCQNDGGSLTPKIVADFVRRTTRAAKVQPEGVHVLRHTFCSHLAMRGAPARAIQELAGHQDLSTTQRYMHLSPAAIQGAIRLLDQRGIAENFGDIVETAPRSVEKGNR